MEESHFSPIFPGKMRIKPLSPCAFYKHDSCFPLPSDKQGFLCPRRGTIVVGDETPPQSLLKTPCAVFSQCCSAVAGVTAGGRMGAVVTWQQSGYFRLLLWMAQEVLWSFQPSSCWLCSACSQLCSIHHYGRDCRTD